MSVPTSVCQYKIFALIVEATTGRKSVSTLINFLLKLEVTALVGKGALRRYI
jgi:hypothetical protein